eukprot:9952837-Alexandrium_andersonii.AAC.1
MAVEHCDPRAREIARGAIQRLLGPSPAALLVPRVAPHTQRPACPTASGGIVEGSRQSRNNSV